MNWTQYLGNQLLGINNPAVTIATVTSNVINILLTFAGVVAVVYLIIGGYQYITSAGNAEQAGAAKNTILYAIIGLVVIFAAYLIIDYVLTSLHITH